MRKKVKYMRIMHEPSFGVHEAWPRRDISCEAGALPIAALWRVSIGLKQKVGMYAENDASSDIMISRRLATEQWHLFISYFKRLLLS